MHFKVRKCHFGPPEKWQQKSVKMSKEPVFGQFDSPKMDFLDILTDFWGHFSGGPKWHFRTLNCTFGVSGFQGSVAGRGSLQTSEHVVLLHYAHVQVCVCVCVCARACVVSGWGHWKPNREQKISPKFSCIRSLPNDNKFSDNKNRKNYKFYCHGISQEKQRFRTIFREIPPPQPPPKRKFY